MRARQVLTAGASDELVTDDGSRPGHSAFTSVLLRGYEGGADDAVSVIITASVLDGCSRRCIGWSLGRHLDASLTIAALQQALQQRTVVPGLVHHSDRGVQYASHRYTELLQAHAIQISISRRGNLYDNATAAASSKP